MSRRKVGGVIKKPKSPKISLKEEKEEEDENEGEIGDLMKSNDPAKTKPITKKGGKAAVQQEQILLEIQNENTTKQIKELCSKFEPPACKQCPNRNDERIYVCQACGHQEYLSLICGKCHNTKHTDAKEKPELDVEEFFVKLGTFLNETKADSSFREQGIDVKKLQGALDKIAEFENKLGGIKETFSEEIATYKSPEEVEGALAGSLVKAMSKPTYANIQDQLADIKGAVSFDNNEFKWNSIQDKLVLLRDQANVVKEESLELKKAINFSFFGGKEVNLAEVQLLQGMSQLKGNQFSSQIGLNTGNQITLQTMAKSNFQQVFLDYEIDPSKKYIFQFTLSSFQNAVFFVGLMQEHQAKKILIQNAFQGFVLKRFYCSSPTQDCSKVLKGNMFGNEIHSGDSFEMRFCIEDQIFEFSTLPGHQNVNSKLDETVFDISPNSKYVITISTYNNIGLTLNSLKELFFFPLYN